MGAIFQELFRAGIYKRSQGRITRQVTFGMLVLLLTIGFWRLYETLRFTVGSELFGIEYWLPGMLMVASWWFSYRLMNVPSVADFLIAVEAELNKVSWPGRAELARSAVVVLVCIIFLSFLLFTYDIFWKFVFQSIGLFG